MHLKYGKQKQQWFEIVKSPTVIRDFTILTSEIENKAQKNKQNVNDLINMAKHLKPIDI